MRPQETVDFGWDHYLHELDKDLSYVDVGIVKADAAVPALVRVRKKNGEKSDVESENYTITLSDSMTLGEKAAYNEFGTDKAPERPFLRQTFDEQLPELQALADKLEQEILIKRESKRHALSTLGVAHQTRIQKNIATKGKFEENAEITKERKGSSMPLIDSKQLGDAITYEVG